MKRPRNILAGARTIDYRSSTLPNYKKIAARAKVQADPKATLACLVAIVQFRHRDFLDNTWTTFAAFDDHNVAAIYREGCANNQKEMEFRCVSLEGRTH